ncbi:MAG: hypoxanthine phosphoribosyltransferase [Bilophila sp.]
MRITKLKPLYSAEEIQDRVKTIAEMVNTLYKNEPLVVICVLKGAFMFFSDLVKHLTCKPELDFVRLASYGRGTTSARTINFTKDVEIPLEGKHVLIVEDVIDTGHSMDFLFRQLAARGARSLRLAVLVDKHERREVPVTAHFAGFTLPTGFIVGYGLDYAEHYRELPAIFEAEIED